jgi:RimJ/RimL family protein N-acetyltransferase
MHAAETGGVNELGQPVGALVPNWTPRRPPTTPVLTGRYCRLERLDPHRHTDELFAADQRDERGESWTYLPYGPFANLGAYRRWVEDAAGVDDPFFYAVVDTDPARGAPGLAVGVLSYLRIHVEWGSIEVGHVHYSPALQRRRASTEAQYLLMSSAFDDLGYRRYEWKCDALNAPSRSAAERLGFRYEGTFRQALIVEGRNRDTAWYSVTDAEWPVVRHRLETWLAPGNFDGRGHQRLPLRPRHDAADRAPVESVN